MDGPIQCLLDQRWFGDRTLEPFEVDLPLPQHDRRMAGESHIVLGQDRVPLASDAFNAH